jgi:hypothetical protein
MNKITPWTKYATRHIFISLQQQWIFHTPAQVWNKFRDIMTILHVEFEHLIVTVVYAIDKHTQLAIL